MRGHFYISSKINCWILNVHCIMSYLRKLEPDVPNNMELNKHINCNHASCEILLLVSLKSLRPPELAALTSLADELWFCQIVSVKSAFASVNSNIQNFSPDKNIFWLVLQIAISFYIVFSARHTWPIYLRCCAYIKLRAGTVLTRFRVFRYQCQDTELYLPSSHL